MTTTRELIEALTSATPGEMIEIRRLMDRAIEETPQGPIFPGPARMLHPPGGALAELLSNILSYAKRREPIPPGYIEHIGERLMDMGLSAYVPEEQRRKIEEKRGLRR